MIFDGLSDYVNKKCIITVNVKTASWPKFSIVGGVFDLSADIIAETFATFPDGKVMPILTLEIATDFGVSSGIVDNSNLKLNLDHVKLTKLTV